MRPDGEWSYRAWWAHDLEEEAAAARSLIDFLADRRAAHPGMHVYHYNHTERSALERLALDHGVGEVTLAELVETGAFVDLLVVARNALQVGTESYGLKYLERLTTFERGHDIDQGAGAVVEYEAFMASHDPESLTRIAAYNEDDVRATRALRDWLIEHRPTSVEWRAARLDPDDALPELDEQVALLHGFGPDTPEHLLGDLLGYWRREWQAHVAPLLARCQADTGQLLDDPEALAGLVPVERIERIGKKGKPLMPGHAIPTAGPGDRLVPLHRRPGRLHDPRGADWLLVGRSVSTPTPVSSTSCGTSVAMSWRRYPTVVVRNDWVAPKPKPEALTEFASRVLDPGGVPPNPVSLALLRRELPAFVAGRRPSRRTVHRRSRRDDGLGHRARPAATSPSRGRRGPARPSVARTSCWRSSVPVGESGSPR